MPERPRRPDLDERFSLFPEDAEDVLRQMMGVESEDESEPPEDDHP
jgi:hypothetical protein